MTWKGFCKATRGAAITGGSRMRFASSPPEAIQQAIPVVKETEIWTEKTPGRPQAPRPLPSVEGAPSRGRRARRAARLRLGDVNRATVGELDRDVVRALGGLVQKLEPQCVRLAALDRAILGRARERADDRR